MRQLPFGNEQEWTVLTWFSSSFLRLASMLCVIKANLSKEYMKMGDMYLFVTPVCIEMFDYNCTISEANEMQSRVAVVLFA